MIIGFDGSRAFVKNRTGTENYSYQLLKHLAKIDTENSYIVYVRSHNVIPVRETQPESIIWPKNFQFKVIPLPRLWTQLGLALRTFLDPIGILFVPAHTFPLIHKPGLKIVMTIHDLGAEYLPAMHQLKQKLYLDFITKYQLKSATKLIAVSKSTKKDLIKRTQIPEKNIEVIYEGINRDQFKPVKNDSLINTLNKYDLAKRKYFLFVGTIQPRKNLKRLIEAFKVLTLDSGDLQLVLVGSKGWQSDEIYELPSKLGIKPRVKFLGHIKDQELVALYSGAVALLYPSLYEGFGLPILEAMNCGCPVITSNISSMPEIVGNAALLVNPESTEDLADQAHSLIIDDDLRNTLIQKGYNQAKKFNWEKCAKETLKLLMSLSAIEKKSGI